MADLHPDISISAAASDRSRSRSRSRSQSRSRSPSVDSAADGPPVTISITYRGQTREEDFVAGSTLEDLAFAVRAELGIREENQKFLVSGLGLLRPTTDAARDRPLADLEGKKIVLIGTETSRIQSFQAAEKSAQHRDAARRAARRANHHRSGASSSRHAYPALKYKFHQIAPLPNLPDPDRSRALLERLAADPGIRAVMARHRLEVGLLTEMEPLSNTQSTHEGTTRLLGLNRNQGEAIELRLWTDAYDGYRDYNTIRKTLCHELAHNRHGPHDRQFWDFCHKLEREVHAISTGRTVGEPDESFAPSREEDVDDHGGWTGGEFVLGSGEAAVDTSKLSRREILARAAEERRRRMDDDDPNGGNQGPSSAQ